MNTDRNLIRLALERLRDLGIEGNLTDQACSNHPVAVDAHVELSRADGKKQHFGALIKRVVRPSTLAAVADQVRALETEVPILLVSEHISVETAELLRRRRIPFIDAAGNAWLDTPDFLVAVLGRRPTQVAGAPTPERIGAAALRVMFVLLRDPDAGRLPVHSLGERAGVSHGAAALALQTFDARGWIRDLGNPGYRVVDVEGMLSTWLVGFADRLAPKLEITRAASPGAASPASWAQGMLAQFAPDTALLGGEAAAMFAGHPLRGNTATVYVRVWDADTMKRLRLVPAREGAIVVRGAFAPHLEDPDDPRLVDPLVVLGELTAIPDERLDETRAALRAAVASIGSSPPAPNGSATPTGLS